MEITPLGDCALLVRVRDRIAKVPSETLREVLAVLRRLEIARVPGVIELAPAYTTVAVFFDPVRVVAAGAPPDAVFDWLAERIRQGVEGVPEADGGVRTARLVEIPVCYGGEFGPDLDEVARHTGLTADEIVRRHHAVEYCVHGLGFTPGFPYLSGLSPELAVPRRATPRTAVPAGTVAIGGAQTGIYPLRSPGGWRLIGRTPRTLFSVQQEPPALLRPGDRVRFRPITRDEFERWIQ
ncbi:MAG: inhibitor of KinA [Chthoniobacter sp.]|jgi:inhibitor of KinA|nr:inhibitor of KinA [Chthoniobacter sp.]